MMARWRGFQMLISLPARVPLLIHIYLLPSPCPHVSACPHRLSHYLRVRRMQLRPRRPGFSTVLSPAAKQSCRSGLPACHEGAAEWHTVVAGSQIARPQWTSTDAAALRLRSEVGSLRPSERSGRVESLSASSTGENARCECCQLRTRCEWIAAIKRCAVADE